MKRTFLFILICLFIFPCLFAQDAKAAEESEADELAETEITEEEFSWDDWAFYLEGEKQPFRVKDRSFEIGFIPIRVGFANNFITAADVFNSSRKLIINFNELEKGFKVNFDLGIGIFHFNYNKGGRWGFGLAAGIDAYGILGLSGNMLTFKEIEGDLSDVSGALFADVKISSFFHIDRFKVKVNPSVFYPIAYVESDISYTFLTPDKGPIVHVGYDVSVYTAANMENIMNGNISPNGKIGIDWHLGAEYPLADALRLTDMFSFLDFKVGVDLINIPMVPAQLSEYMRIRGNVGRENESLDFLDTENLMDYFLEDGESEPVYGSGVKNITRPFKMLAWADWKPFESAPFSFIPTIGFAVNPLYHQMGSLEACIKTRMDLANLFIVTLGVGYHDRLWQNSLDLVLNFRFVELNFGINLRSQEFVDSWRGGGVGINLGMKLGG